MTIKRNESPESGFIVMCDFCSNYEEMECVIWHEVIERMKQDGWRNFKNKDGEWVSKCPVCMDNYEEGK